MNILGIESTCDETGVAVVEGGVKVLKSVVSSSVDLHVKYGGVVPEIAAREQVRVIIPLIELVLSEIPISKIDAIAVSYGPGLIGPLLVGVETAKTLAFAYNKKLIAVNHLVGHIYSSWLEVNTFPKFPLIGLVVSGGHTDLVLIRKHNDFKLLGSTLDDAVGEAFDKVAKKLGLSYPGGPEVEKAASKFQISNDKLQSDVKFPKPMINSKDFNFSFSGIKTSVATYVDKNSSDKNIVAGVSYEFQKSVCDVLVSKTLRAAEKYDAKSIVVGGGVAANNFLHEQFLKSSKVKVYFPNKKYSVDNGAMIASAAFFTKNFVRPLALTAETSLHF